MNNIINKEIVGIEYNRHRNNHIFDRVYYMNKKRLLCRMLISNNEFSIINKDFFFVLWQI